MEQGLYRMCCHSTVSSLYALIIMVTVMGALSRPSWCSLLQGQIQMQSCNAADRSKAYWIESQI